MILWHLSRLAADSSTLTGLCALPRTATHLHTATHCNTLQQHCSTLQHAVIILQCTAMHCNELQCSILTAACAGNMLQHTTTHYSTLQHCSTLATHLQHTASHYNAPITHFSFSFSSFCPFLLHLLLLLARAGRQRIQRVVKVPRRIAAVLSHYLPWQCVSETSLYACISLCVYT